MIRAVIYLILLLAILVYVERSKWREPRVAIWTLTITSFLTLTAALLGATFYAGSWLFTLVDLVALAAFLTHALKSRFYWTLCLPAFQLIPCMTNLAKFVAPDILPRVYAASQGIWAYPQMLVILLAAIWANQKSQAARHAPVPASPE
jgi:hypothetical protein